MTDDSSVLAAILLVLVAVVSAWGYGHLNHWVYRRRVARDAREALRDGRRE